MTLETAKRIVDEGTPNKEAEAIVRGGMTICETETDGNRNYKWIKVLPTTSDSVSSVEVALRNYRRRNNKQQQTNIETETISEEKENPQMPNVTSPPENIEPLTLQLSFFERLKRKAIVLWNEIDSIVIE